MKLVKPVGRCFKIVLLLAAFTMPCSSVAQQAPQVLDLADTVSRDGVLVVRSTGLPVNGTLVARHPNGRLKQRYSVIEGLPDGAWLEWSDQGVVTLYAEWRRGLGDGIWVYFHPNGEVRERAEVQGDIWNGVAEGWHDNGVKAFESQFNLGVRPLPVRRWNRDGLPVGPWVSLVGTVEKRSFVALKWPSNRSLWDFSFSLDLESVFVATGEADGSGRQIFLSRWRDGAWSPPEPAPFADPGASEGTPSVSPDGRHVYFSSDRHKRTEPENRKRDLYRASAMSGWRNVERVTETPEYGEISLSFNQARDGVMWTDHRVGDATRMGLYQVRIAKDAARPSIRIVRGLNDLHRGDAANENSAAISPDGRAIVFANFDVDRVGTDEDLYVACRTNSGWASPTSLGAVVNSAGTESSPQFIGDGNTLAWRYEGSEGQGIRFTAFSAAMAGCSPT